ncbi:uncharacterized protein LOC122074209 [Macadamia integrifolia]|uniref:uncharacterized protein LOC122074209 n=1 Tax=Macadamia integrifolia TaxID=60698 RepID=UPI001C4E6295|nr:uncharacterized protein LOC122074209 [Macadamia integrifolia]
MYVYPSKDEPQLMADLESYARGMKKKTLCSSVLFLITAKLKVGEKLSSMFEDMRSVFKSLESGFVKTLTIEEKLGLKGNAKLYVWEGLTVKGLRSRGGSALVEFQIFNMSSQMNYATLIKDHITIGPNYVDWRRNIKLLITAEDKTIKDCVKDPSFAKDMLEEFKKLYDSDFQTDKDDRKSPSRMVFVLRGDAIVWKSVKQKSMVDSTTEAEYLAASEAVKEGVWLKKFLTDLEVVPELVEHPIMLYCDNRGAIA